MCLHHWDYSRPVLIGESLGVFLAIGISSFTGTIIAPFQWRKEMHRPLIAAVIIATTAATLLGQSPEQIESFAVRSKKWKATIIENLHARLSNARGREKKEQIKSDIATAESETVYTSIPTGNTLPNHAVGVLHHNSVDVVQVIDGENALAYVTTGYIVDSITLSTSPIKRAVWFEGINTAGWTNGTPAEVNDVLFIAGTKQYATTDGSTNTVPHAVRVSPDVLTKHFQPAPSGGEKESSPAKQEPIMRTWTDVTGRFSIEAEFAGVIGNTVRLRKADGDKVEVSIGRLSEADREWIGNRK